MNDGIAIAARMPMIRMTTKSSIRVKPPSCFERWRFLSSRSFRLPGSARRATVAVGVCRNFAGACHYTFGAARDLELVFGGYGFCFNRERGRRAFGFDQLRRGFICERGLDFLQVGDADFCVFAIFVGADGLRRRLRSFPTRRSSDLVGLALLVDERRNCDRGEDADDQ